MARGLKSGVRVRPGRMGQRAGDGLGGDQMNSSLRFSAGRADPFGLLVLAVMLALSVTIGIQAALADNPGPQVRPGACPAAWCLSLDQRE